MTCRLVLVITLIPIACAGLGCDRGREVTAATDVVKPPVEDPPGSDTEPIDELPCVSLSENEPIVDTLSLDSHLMVERNVGVTARRDGIVEEIHRDRGDRVAEGEPLATMERQDLVLGEATAILELEKEESSWGRARRLFEQKVISSEEFETARLRRDAAEKTLERIRYEISKSVIRAPFDGVVSGRFVEKGQVLREDDRTILFQVTALSPLLARIYIPEWALFGLPGDPLVVVTPTGGSSPRTNGSGFDARVKWLSDVVDAASGSVEALVEVREEDEGGIPLRPGMSVRVDLELSFEGHSIPLTALPHESPEPGMEYNIRILDEEGVARSRTVRVGIVGETRVEILSGVEPGEKVVLAR